MGQEIFGIINIDNIAEEGEMTVIFLPILSIALLLISTVVSFKNKEKRNFSIMFVTVNGALMLSFIVFVLGFVQNESIITQVPPLVYWFMIAAGLLLAVVSYRFAYVPGGISAAALHLFVGFAAILSIGPILLLLALVELWLAFSPRGRMKKAIV